MKLNIDVVRAKRKLSRVQLARKAGVSSSYISELISGKYKNPSICVLCKIAKALNCTLDELVDCSDCRGDKHDGTRI